MEDQIDEEELAEFDQEERSFVNAQKARHGADDAWTGRRLRPETRLSLVLVPLILTLVFLRPLLFGSENLAGSKQLLSEDMQRALDLCQRGVSKCVMFSMKDSGLGSQLLNMYANSMYLKEVYGYETFMVDEAAYEGYRIDGKPVLSAYFETPFPRLESQEQYQGLSPYLPQEFGQVQAYDEMEYDVRANATFKGMVTSNAAALVMVSHLMFHSEIKPWITRLPVGGYNRMVDTMCPGLQFELGALEKLEDQRKQMYGVLPDLRQQAYTSVAFHVRRTDKIQQGESTIYPAMAYVEKFMAVLEKYAVAKESVRVCFLATDDFSVTSEMQTALTAHGISCRLVFSPLDAANEPSKTSAGNPSVRYREEQGLVFMTELSVMLEATYFVGTFGSNVGALVSVLRGCPSRYNASLHYANSFGVDKSRWYFR